jgi:signal peptidase II
MQAARGTSLSDAENTQPEPATGTSPRPRALFVAVALTAYAVDVVSKVVAVERLSGGRDVDLLGTWFTLHLTRNPGAAFSTGTEFTVVISLIAVGAVGVVVYLSRKVRSTGWAWALGLLLGGVAGNLTDRIVRDPGPLRGHVIDFFMLPHWPVFNVADICINVAAGLILLQALRGVAIDGSRTSPRKVREQQA